MFGIFSRRSYPKRLKRLGERTKRLEDVVFKDIWPAPLGDFLMGVSKETSTDVWDAWDFEPDKWEEGDDPCA